MIICEEKINWTVNWRDHRARKKHRTVWARVGSDNVDFSNSIIGISFRKHNLLRTVFTGSIRNLSAGDPDAWYRVHRVRYTRFIGYSLWATSCKGDAIGVYAGTHFAFRLYTPTQATPIVVNSKVSFDRSQVPRLISYRWSSLKLVIQLSKSSFNSIIFFQSSNYQTKTITLFINVGFYLIQTQKYKNSNSKIFHLSTF